MKYRGRWAYPLAFYLLTPTSFTSSYIPLRHQGRMESQTQTAAQDGASDAGMLFLPSPTRVPADTVDLDARVRSSFEGRAHQEITFSEAP